MSPEPLFTGSQALAEHRVSSGHLGTRLSSRGRRVDALPSCDEEASHGNFWEPSHVFGVVIPLGLVVLFEVFVCICRTAIQSVFEQN